MAIQTEPTRIQIPFADSGTKNTIPDTQPTPSASQAASWTDGFPAQCSLPLSAGGIPPARADFNGIFNAITQSARFTEEGGIWKWDAAVDYDANRLVLGSDGLLYWSMGQSGPNTGAGAVNPTADDGTYWGSALVAVPGTVDNSNKIANTKWVRNAILSVPIYVNPSTGNDNYSGTSLGGAVKTINKALSIAQNRTGSYQNICLASGTYNEYIDIKSKLVQFSLQGNVTITGGIFIHRNAALSIDYADGVSTATFTAKNGNSTCISANTGGLFLCKVPCVVQTSGADSGVFATNCSNIIFDDSLSISMTSGTVDVINISNGSSIIAPYGVVISGSTSSYGFNISRNSFAYIRDGLDASLLQCSESIEVAESSTCIVFGGDVYLVSTTQGVTINVRHNSLLRIIDTTSLTILSKNSGDIIDCFYGSTVDILVPSGKVCYITSQDVASLNALGCSINSTFALRGSGTFTFAGSFDNAICYSAICSLVRIENTLTLNGSPTGKRYDCVVGGFTRVGGLGANRIPGSIAGTVETSTYSYYG